MKHRLVLLTGLAVLLASGAALSQTYKNFPGAAFDQKTMRAQERAEQAYEFGDYELALLIYRKELAPVGDKYAQYMVGYMHFSGKGVPPNRPQALAWYRLAAERGEPVIVKVRDELYESMAPEEVVASNEIFVDLWQKIGDNRLIFGLIREDIELLRERTGTRIPGGSSGGRLTIIKMSGYAGSERFYADVEERLKNRLRYIKTNVEIIDIEQDQQFAAIHSLEQEVRRELESIDMP